MAKTKVAPPAESKQDTIPLSDISVTRYRDAYFSGEDGDTPVVITGRQLGQVLSCLARSRPGISSGATRRVSNSRPSIWK
jgi:hypothetical protein